LRVDLDIAQLVEEQEVEAAVEADEEGRDAVIGGFDELACRPGHHYIKHWHRLSGNVALSRPRVPRLFLRPILCSKSCAAFECSLPAESTHHSPLDQRRLVGGELLDAAPAWEPVDLRVIRRSVTNQVTTTPDDTRRGTTRSDTEIYLACSNPTQRDAIRRNRHAW
jgi:hypothetical protein